MGLLEQYRQDGVVCIRKAFSDEWLSKLGLDIDRIVETPKDLTAD
jgi:hypothetical protein